MYDASGDFVQCLNFIMLIESSLIFVTKKKSESFLHAIKILYTINLIIIDLFNSEV